MEEGEAMNVQTFGIGQAMATPDVCKTPPLAIPAPFPNISLNATAVPAQYQIMIQGQPILTVASVNPMTSGDEAGTLGGVVSQTIKGPCNTVMGSMAYIVGGSPVQRCLDPTTQNGGNSLGTHQVPSQTIVTVLR